MTAAINVDVAVLGGGPGGCSAAMRAAQRRGKPRVMREIRSGGSPAAAACGRTGEDEPTRLTGRQLLERVTSRQARCAGADVDPDAWFPVATRWQQARAEAAPALALCAACPVRAECLELSMRQWSEAGRHGVWGGLLEAERAAVRAQWLAGASVVRLLAGECEDRQALSG